MEIIIKLIILILIFLKNTKQSGITAKKRIAVCFDSNPKIRNRIINEMFFTVGFSKASKLTHNAEIENKKASNSSLHFKLFTTSV